ncbi:class I SAM-dependent methyltransferase [Aldersonia kunmingensis]|uniref:class I SAM-dependent methyltransferase n=1 Tax=Aldersonia kunmingensis TaxID=408066 RepID=UPI000A55B196|nr:methyltransferase domain-containing protein [Aldersonia kunmingensis]
MNAQHDFWTQWVQDSVEWEVNKDNERRAHHVLDAIDRLARPDPRTLDIGCGTGWLTTRLATRGDATGVDLPTEPIAELGRRHPEITWQAGDFVALDLPGGYDAIVSLETVAHVPDQQRFVARIAELLRPGGVVVLTTQNPTIWNRTSFLRPPGPGQIRNWPTRARLMELFEPYFALEPIRTCAPGGDRGWLRVLHSRPVNGSLRRVLGDERWTATQERLGLGRSLVLVGTLR